jgi:hypothetical protein
MYCPNCGAENDERNRFCVNCGSELSSRREASGATARPKDRGARDRLAQLVGPTRRARLATAVTVIALVIAVVAFLSLDTNGDETAESPYLQSVDRVCVAEKERISALGREVLSQELPNPREFPSVLVTALAEWQSSLRQTPPPPEHAEEIQALEASLLATLVEAGKLSRLIREEASAQVINKQAQAVDEATGRLNETIDVSGLPVCADLQVSPLPENQP